MKGAITLIDTQRVHDNAFFALSFARENLSFQAARSGSLATPNTGGESPTRHGQGTQHGLASPGCGNASVSAKLHDKRLLEKLTSRTSRKAVVKLELARDCFQQPALPLPLLQRPHSSLTTGIHHVLLQPQSMHPQSSHQRRHWLSHCRPVPL
jgi:hypothetical protein